MGKPRAYNSKQLTGHLRELLAEASDIVDGDGEGIRCLTKGEVLAGLIVQRALGYTEKKRDDEGKETEVVHEPARWAIELLWDRVEGKVPQAITEDTSRPKVADRVGDLSTKRLNALTGKILSAQSPKPPPPPSFKQDDNAE